MKILDLILLIGVFVIGVIGIGMMSLLITESRSDETTENFKE